MDSVIALQDCNAKTSLVQTQNSTFYFLAGGVNNRTKNKSLISEQDSLQRKFSEGESS